MGDKSNKLVLLAQQLRTYKPSHSIDNQTHLQPSPVLENDRNAGPREYNSIQESARLKRAAVLVCIFEGSDGDLRVILTKRSSMLSSHSGEVSLPGGKREEIDLDDVDTALREAKEEIGLDPSLIDAVTVLEPFWTKVGLPVVPVVGILFDRKAFNPAPNANEVESIFDVPLEMFLKDENRRAEERQWMGDKYLLHFFDYQSGNERYVIWALTAGILIKIASVVYQQSPAFLEQRPPFWNGCTKAPPQDMSSCGFQEMKKKPFEHLQNSAELEVESQALGNVE